MNILISGSCVSRDALEFIDAVHKHKLVSYHARSSLATLNSQPVPDIYFSEISNIPSSFQRKMVTFDFGRDLLSNIDEMDFDLLLMDLIDERFNLGVLGESLVTCSSEFYKTNIKPIKLILANSPEFMELWCLGVDILFKKLIESNCIKKVRVQKAFWASILDTGEFINKYTPKMIASQNNRLLTMYKYLENYLSSDQFIDIPDELLKIKSDHKWGISPFHYIDDYYRFVISRLIVD